MQSFDLGSQQVLTVFGGGYVAEGHAEEAHRNLAAPEGKATSVSLLWLAFYVVIAVAAVSHKISHII
jgi:hypothetical protein